MRIDVNQPSQIGICADAPVLLIRDQAGEHRLVFGSAVALHDFCMNAVALLDAEVRRAQNEVAFLGRAVEALR
jgi:hypothetical protein